MIETPRMQIVTFSEKYLTQRYVSWLTDQEVVRYSDQRFRTHTLESCREYWEFFKNSPNYFWAINVQDGELGYIGTMTAYHDTNHSVADVGILIGEKKTWGSGYGSEAWIAVCDYLLRIEEIRKVTAGTLTVNIGMLKIMQRTGMVDDGRRNRQCLHEGLEVDMVHKALFREDWLLRYPRGPYNEREVSD